MSKQIIVYIHHGFMSGENINNPEDIDNNSNNSCYQHRVKELNMFIAFYIALPECSKAQHKPEGI